MTANDGLTDIFFSISSIGEGSHSTEDAQNGGTYEIEHKNEHKTALCGLGSRPYAILHAMRIPLGETLFQNQSQLRINFCVNTFWLY